MQGNYDRNLTWWSKDGVWSWWATQFDPFATGLVAKPNRTTSSSGHLGDLDSTGGFKKNISRPIPSSGDGESKDGNDDEADDKGNDAKQGDANEQGSEVQQQNSGGGDNIMVEAGDEATSPIRPTGGEWPGGPKPDAATDDVGDMTYVCDDKLGGAPNPLDCEKLSWSGLKPPNSIETLQPGLPQFYSQGSLSLLHRKSCGHEQPLSDAPNLPS